jgi:hypothetical protein
LDVRVDGNRHVEVADGDGEADGDDDVDTVVDAGGSAGVDLDVKDVGVQADVDADADADVDGPADVSADVVAEGDEDGDKSLIVLLDEQQVQGDHRAPFRDHESLDPTESLNRNCSERGTVPAPSGSRPSGLPLQER